MENQIINKKDFLLYKDSSGEIKVNVLLINDDLWLTQELIAKLFGKARNTITGHINNIFKEGEITKTFYKTVQNKMHYAVCLR